MSYFLILFFGGLGALCRYALTMAFPMTQFPWATLVANVLGSFLLGGLFSLRLHGVTVISDAVHLAIMVGFLGALTTFSTFSLQNMEFFRAGFVNLFWLNISMNLVLCLIATFLGERLTNYFL